MPGLTILDSSMSSGSKAEALAAEACRIARSSSGICFGYMVVMVALGLWVDTTETGAQVLLLPNVVSIPLGYFLTTEMIDRSGLGQGSPSGGFAIYLGLSIVSGIALFVGFVLLLLPGLVLLVRWAPAYAIALVEGVGATSALQRAWHMTKGHGAAIFIVMLVPIALAAGGIGLSLFLETDETLMAIPESLVLNIGLFGATVAGTAIGLASYSLLCDRYEGVAKVFD